MDLPGPNGSLPLDYEPVDAAGGTAIVVHGLGGFKDQPHIVAIAHACRDAGLSTIRMNTRHALTGDGSAYANATTSASIEDLHAVVEWTRAQPWFTEPLVLAGHSLGGISVLEEAHEHGADLLVPVSPVVSAERLLDAFGANVDIWRSSGWRESRSKPGVMKRLKWNAFEADLKRYDTLAYAHDVKIPTLLIVGSEDGSTRPEDVRSLAEALPHATLHVIEGAPHTFKSTEHLNELKRIIRAWLDEALAAANGHETSVSGPDL